MNLNAIIKPQQFSLAARLILAAFGGFAVTCCFVNLLFTLLNLVFDQFYAMQMSLIFSFAFYALLVVWIIASRHLKKVAGQLVLLATCLLICAWLVSGQFWAGA